MGKVSRKKLHRDIEDRIFDVFWEVLASIKTKVGIQSFLLSLLSYTEQLMLAKRLAIALLVHRGYSYEEISKRLNVSTSTVGTVHKAILIGATGYKDAIQLIEQVEKREEFWDKFEELLLRWSPAAAVGSAAYLRKRDSGIEIVRRRRSRNIL